MKQHAIKHVKVILTLFTLLAISSLCLMQINACLPPPPPSAPTGLTAKSISTTRIDLSWNDVSSETGYKIERSPNGTNSWAQVGTTAANVVTFSNINLTPGTTYYYRVKAYNAGGDSSPSNTANTATQAAITNCLPA